MVFDGRCREAPAYDFRSVADDHEGLRVEFVDDFLDLGYFRQLDDGVDDPFVLHGVSALAVEIGGAVADVAHEDLGDWRSPVGNDDDAFTLFEADDDLVGNEGCNVNGDEGQDGPFQGEEPGGRQEDDQIEDHRDRAHFQGIIFLDDGADDVQAAAVAVVFIDDTEADAGQDAARNGREHGIVHDVPRRQEGRGIDQDREHDRADDAQDRIAAAHEFITGNHDWDVEDEDTDADGQACQEVNHDGYPAEAAAQQMEGDEEGIHADGDDQAADEGRQVGDG